MSPHAEIVGAGFAGLAAATALAQAGWSVRVHERDPVARTVGSGIYVQPFAQQVLRRLGLFERFAAEAFHPRTRAIYVDGRRCSTTDISGHFLGITRARLHHLLVEAARGAGVELAFGSTVAEVEAAGALRLAEGERVPADLVVLADGVRSGLTEALGISVHRTRHQDGIIRVLRDRSGMRGPQWDEVIDAYDYRFRPLRMLYSPCGHDAFYFCLMAPAGSERAGLPVEAALWSASFPMFAPAIARIGDGGHYDRYTTTTLSRWSAGRVAVVGDAAHVMPSSLGQGAGVSMLNALALVRAVVGGNDVPGALAGWEARTRPMVEAWQRRAEQVAADRYLAGPRHPGADFEAEKPAATPPIPDWLMREGRRA